MTLAVLCPGQGTQHPDMLRLVESDPRAHRVLDAAAVALGTDVRLWLREPDDIAHNVIAQPLICVAQLATWRALCEELPTPALLAGYSVGELGAYGCAGALEAHALSRLAHTRALAMDAALAGRNGGLMLVDGLAQRDLARLCADRQAWPAIVIDAQRCLVGGLHADLDAVAADARERGARVERLRVPIPSHTPLLTAAVTAFGAALEASSLRTPRVPVLAGIDAALVTTRERAIESLSRQLAQTIDWAGCLDAAYERGCRVFLELGPGAALTRMVRERFTDVQARAVEDFHSLAGVVRWTRAHA